MNVKKLISQLPFQLLLIILFVAFFGEKIPLVLQQNLYAISICIKEILIFVLPVVIFALIFNSMIQMTHGALKVIFFLFISICLSNFLVACFSYFISASFLPTIDLAINVKESVETLQPAFKLNLGLLIKNEYALICGLLLGIFFVYNHQQTGERLAKRLVGAANLFLNKIFVPVVPVFILGIMIQLKHDGVLIELLKDYSAIIGVIVLAEIVYVLCMYYAANKFSITNAITSIKNMLPAGLTGICTMSSAASLPMVLKGTAKNTKDSKFTELVISAGININLVGDGIATVMIINAVLLSFGHEMLTLSQFFVFAFWYVMLRFAGAAVPAGGILVILPLLETTFGFTSEMIGVVQAIYVFCDAFSASVNVMGNGAFAIAFKNIFGSKISFKQDDEQTEQDLGLVT